MGIVLGILVGFNLLPSVLYVTSSDALARIDTHIVKDLGGVPISRPQLRYGGFWWFQNLCIDEPCPTFAQDFLVPIEPGKENAFMDEELLAPLGYGPSPSTSCHLEKPGALCQEFAAKAGSKVYLLLDPVAKQRDRIPRQDVSPKVWRTLTIESSP